jgi:YD repeat-containing protein
MVDADGKQSQQGYDDAGNRTWSEDANGNRFEYKYSDLNTPTEVWDMNLPVDPNNPPVDGPTRRHRLRGSSGAYQGVEVKSGTAGLTASQRVFDGQVDSGVPATAMLYGVPITITSTYQVRVP